LKTTDQKPTNQSTNKPPGKQAKRLRQTRQLDGCLSRILERLQPAAARLDPRLGLTGMSVARVCEMVTNVLGAEAAKALEEDLGVYVSLCGALG
jgi:hypothetical protein